MEPLNMKQPILRTARLEFFPFSLDDTEEVVGLHSDPAVMRYLSPGGSVWSRAEIETRLQRWIDEHQRLGHSKWKVCGHDGTMLGRAGFSVFEPTGELELGFTFYPAYWGRGLATEAAKALACWMFTKRTIDHVIGFAHIDNRASRAVLEKIGMHYTHHQTACDLPCAFYTMARPPGQTQDQ
jgi:[ribosomal protein S5]-alanine N-acetyltransferase